jgi:hypothetical protein
MAMSSFFSFYFSFRRPSLGWSSAAAQLTQVGLNLFCRAMDISLLADLVAKNKPFRLETASGRIFDVPHRDFINFSPRKTTLSIFYEENGEEHFALMPLLMVTSAMMKQ